MYSDHSFAIVTQVGSFFCMNGTFSDWFYDWFSQSKCTLVFSLDFFVMAGGLLCLPQITKQMFMAGQNSGFCNDSLTKI
jgi:hypothetical protein